DEISIPEDPLGKKKPSSKKRGRGEEGAPSVKTTQIVRIPSISSKPRTYIRRNKSPVKEKTPEVEAPKKTITKEESHEEEEKVESPEKRTPLRKKQRVDEKADSEVTNSLEKYLGEGEDESEGDGNEEDEPGKATKPH
ncbi:hypothetical protein KI387_006868, partial [Taxus chinensis]